MARCSRVTVVRGAFLAVFGFCVVLLYCAFSSDSLSSLGYPLRSEVPLSDVSTEAAYDLDKLSKETSAAYEQLKLGLIAERPLNSSQLERLLGMQPDTLYPQMPDYVDRLRRLSKYYFADSRDYRRFHSILNQVERHIPPPYVPQRLSKVLTSEKDGWKGVPKTFKRWKDRLPYWNVEVDDDDGMERRFEEYSRGSKRMKDIWRRIPKPVMKSDIMRYFFLLMEGGIYTDSDTAPLANPSLWGSAAKARSIPYELKLLNRFVSLLGRPQPESNEPIRTLLESDPTLSSTSHSGGEWRSIDSDATSMVLAVEWDAIREKVVDPEHTDERYDGWANGGCPRAIQITQWTMMSKSYHPIFLDAVLTSFENIEKALAEDKMDGTISILEMTGPGLFSDAVHRYLYAKYGVIATDISGMKDAMMLGDILLLKQRAFFPSNKMLWFTNLFMFNTRAEQQTPVMHYFRGSWRDGDRGWEGKGPEEREVR